MSEDANPQMLLSVFLSLMDRVLPGTTAEFRDQFALKLLEYTKIWGENYPENQAIIDAKKNEIKDWINSQHN